MSQEIFALRLASCSILTTFTLVGIGGNVNVEMRFTFSGSVHDRLQLFIQQHFREDEHLRHSNAIFFFKLHVAEL